MNESAKTRKITKELKDNHNCFVRKFSGGMYQSSGLPDTLIIKDGLHIWVEFKEKDEWFSPLQERTRQEMMQQGVDVFLVQYQGDKLWVIDNQYRIEFAKFADGVKLLLDTLISLASTQRKRSDMCFSRS